MPRTLRAIRGATTLDDDTREQMIERVTELVAAMLERNGVVLDDLVSMFFTATDDLHCMFPAEAARKLDLGDVPLICARELDIVGATPRCVRVMVQAESERTRSEIEHVYLHDARSLRPDLSGR